LRKIISVICFILGIAIAGFLLCVWLFGHGRKLSYNKHVFKENQADYSLAAGLIYEDYMKRDTEQNEMYIMSDSSLCYFNSETDRYEEISLTEEQLKSIQNVKRVYQLDKHGLDSIWVNKGFVCFGNINGRNSFVYSVDDVKPQFVNFPDEKVNHIYTEKIDAHWYYACDRSKV